MGAGNTLARPQAHDIWLLARKLKGSVANHHLGSWAIKSKQLRRNVSTNNSFCLCFITTTALAAGMRVVDEIPECRK
ncbi:hypothetical protein DHEL01_v209548 [Diaporthe helianthi]|uniref:Uncharacterized protein n=1 Tax=Diaporthe helianthi TaxID=158607 RepID=A0A2P5HPA3_DIAHE|nr:hypothetical protein DHEL01_v209548 [Diaporthe helianthi]